MEGIIMIDSLKGQLSDWQYGRGIIKDFINLLSESDLDTLFPRKNLNSIRKQCEELIRMETCYVDALKTGKIKFGAAPLTDTSKASLLDKMDTLDSLLEESIEKFEGTETIDWFGDAWNIHHHLSAMIGHEQMHIGQIIAFCYAVGIQIPDKIINKMALDG